MKNLFAYLLLASLFCFSSFIRIKEKVEAAPSPLASYSPEWNNSSYLKCNTAATTNYLSATEKETIYILNLVRMNPVLFANTVVKKYPCAHTNYYESLLKKLMATKSLPILYPDSLCFAGANCHAVNSGAEGYVGHDRSSADCKKKWYYNGECCDYGHDKAIDIVFALLLDQDVASLAHREICLEDYNKIGVSIQPHKRYRYTTVIDFHF